MLRQFDLEYHPFEYYASDIILLNISSTLHKAVYIIIKKLNNND